MKKCVDWQGTLLGERRRGLEAKSKREAQAEVQNLNSMLACNVLTRTFTPCQAEKSKVDADWHAIIAAECTEQTRRARELQRVRNFPEIRALHSKLALCNVLQERDRQVAHKKVMDMREKENQFDETAALKKAEKEYVQELVAKEVAKREAAKIAAEYPSVCRQKREHEKKQREEVKAYQNSIINLCKKEMLEQEESQKKSKQARQREVQNAFEEALAQKQDRKKMRDLQDEQEFLERQLYMDYCDYIAFKRKEVASNKAKNQEAAYVSVSKEVEKLAKETELRKIDAAKKMSESVTLSFEGRQLKQSERRKEEEQQVAFERAKQVQYAATLKAKEKLDGVNQRTYLEKDFENFQQLSKQEQKKRIDEIRGHYRGLAEQISENKRIKERIDLEDKKTSKRLMEKFDLESHELDEYAKNAIEEFRREGKNVIPAINAIRKRVPFPPNPFESVVSTYSRLGFI
ncbi:hypothetical protein HDU83_007980 [Entophlyctis luteolus]|nr:hypothetical protein HDU83_007980 [Entophlyctis luteolus]KAJ3389632.1 hypothetical protein HDU84_008553 [Entophlyctis sp. JEL0112]